MFYVVRAKMIPALDRIAKPIAALALTSCKGQLLFLKSKGTTQSGQACSDDDNIILQRVLSAS
jgi:hypothetical protein